MPHIQEPGATYFITASTYRRIVLTEAERDVVLSSITFLSMKKYDLKAAVVMPDHYHALIRPLEKRNGFYTLGEINHSIKSYTSKQLQRPDVSRIWSSETHDHLIRNGDDFQEKLQYIIANPVKDGLSETPEGYPWLYVRPFLA
jgi:REP element-mobilizing transposase RayT